MHFKHNCMTHFPSMNVYTNILDRAFVSNKSSRFNLNREALFGNFLLDLN